MPFWQSAAHLFAEAQSHFLGEASSVAPVPLLTALLIGALTGYALPRPSTDPAKSGPLHSIATFLGNTSLRRFFLAWHGVNIIREVWYHWTEKGTFRRFAYAVWGLLTGKGWHFDFPTAHEAGLPAGTPCNPEPTSENDDWYVTRKDLHFFQRNGEQDAEVPGASPWEEMMDKEIPNTLKYTSWRRTLPNGKTEYKSVTYSPDTTAEEYIDLFFDDDYRPNWDTMIIEHEVLEDGDFNQRQQVVRWIRRFPFSFISDREYVLGRRLFREGNTLYGITKAVDHPRGRKNSNVVKMDVFYSMWGAQTVPCPWGSGKPACKATLLHHEQFKIPENLARFAVKHGMWSFLRKMTQETPKFIEARRKHCDPFSPDPQAYGAGRKPNPPSPHERAHAHSNFIAAARKGGQKQQQNQASSTSPFLQSSNVQQHRGGDDYYRRSATSPALPAVGGSPLHSPMTAQGSDDLGGMGGSDTQVALGHSGHEMRVHRRNVGRSASASKVKGLAAFALASGLAMLMRPSANGAYESGSRVPVCRHESSKLLNRRRLRRHRTNASSDTCLAEIEGL
uniref:START domain-containing protein n=1 Tax=Dunaliella tertiolecta TaxID=3047 RepID=A0A7S3QP56_DUNTE|mmetsp:Transcript_3186/g.8423  ORF Transcript_3186/g.8423 Transcript_3186/m.8423 type:complete len:562 (+) Transcript_3186:56-1741(+)